MQKIDCGMVNFQNISGFTIGAVVTAFTPLTSNFCGNMIPKMIDLKFNIDPLAFRIIDDISTGFLAFSLNLFWPGVMKGHSLHDCKIDTSKSQTAGNIMGLVPGIFLCLGMANIVRKGNEVYKSVAITAVFSILGMIAGRKLHLDKQNDQNNAPLTSVTTN